MLITVLRMLPDKWEQGEGWALFSPKLPRQKGLVSLMIPFPFPRNRDKQQPENG